MPDPIDRSVHTRSSLLRGMQSGDEDRWREFYERYAPVVRGFAIKAGLTETEADEVVQETCIGVARNICEFRYDPKVCRFKSWLLNLACWRVKNQLTKRQRWDERVHKAPDCPSPGNGRPALGFSDDSDRTASIERVPDPAPPVLEALWDEQWGARLLEAALEKVRARFSPTQFQIFDLNALKEWPAQEVARSLGVSLANVYLTKHRVSVVLKKELQRLSRQMDRGL
jgi:RNA polymerase sigma factor (sigma-70 family)